MILPCIFFCRVLELLRQVSVYELTPSEYLELIDNVEFHMDELYNNYFDTYRFLVALQNEVHSLNEIV